MQHIGPNPNDVCPNESIKQIVYVKNVITRPNIIVGDYTYVAKDVPAYCVAAGNPCGVIRKRFSDALIAYLLNLKWWDWDAGKILRNMEALCSADLTKIKNIAD